jgi:hypothetical protein
MSATCKSCGTSFTPTRSWQEYCKPLCKDRSAKRRLRSAEKCVDMANPLSVPAECVDSRPVTPRGAPPAPSEGLRPYVWPTPPRSLEEIPHGPTPGALQGDEYFIEMDAHGYPILPACLDRNRKAT